MVACSLALTVHQELVQSVIVSVYLHPSRIHWVRNYWDVNKVRSRPDWAPHTSPKAGNFRIKRVTTAQFPLGAHGEHAC